MSRRAEMVAQLMRSLADDRFQIANQYPGISLEPKWPNSEIIVSVGSLVTIFVFSSGMSDVDRSVCAGILSANPGSRVVLIICEGHPNPNANSPVIHDNFARFTSFVEFTHERDTADLALLLAQAVDFSNETLSALILQILTSLGFTQFDKLPKEKEQFVLTALRVAKNADDIEKHDLSPGWVLYVVKSLYPVVRDLTPYRGLLVAGDFMGHSYVLFKESLDGVYREDIGRIASLIKIGAARSVKVAPFKG